MTRIITIGAAQLGPIQKDHTRQQVVREYAEGEETRHRLVAKDRRATGLLLSDDAIFLVRSHSSKHHVPYERAWKP